MASRKDLENLLAIILVVFFIIICAYAIRSLNDERLLVLEEDAEWIAVIFALAIIFLSIEGVNENDLIIVLVGAIIIVISTMLFLALYRSSPPNTSKDNNKDSSNNNKNSGKVEDSRNNQEIETDK